MTGGMSCPEHCLLGRQRTFLARPQAVFKEVRMIFVGIDWAEDHHDLCLLEEQGGTLGKRRLPEGLEGARQL